MPEATRGLHQRCLTKAEASQAHKVSVFAEQILPHSDWSIDKWTASVEIVIIVTPIPFGNILLIERNVP